MAIFRRPDGFSNVTSDNSGGLIPFPTDPEKWMIWKEDFIKYDITQAEGYWGLDRVVAGADTIVGPTGVLALTLVGGADDSLGLQLKNAPFQLTANKKAIFKSRVKIVKGGGTIGQEGFVVGLTSY